MGIPSHLGRWRSLSCASQRAWGGVRGQPSEPEGNTQLRQAVDPGSWSEKERAPFSMEGSPGGLEGQARPKSWPSKLGLRLHVENRGTECHTLAAGLSASIYCMVSVGDFCWAVRADEPEGKGSPVSVSAVSDTSGGSPRSELSG